MPLLCLDEQGLQSSGDFVEDFQHLVDFVKSAKDAGDTIEKKGADTYNALIAEGISLSDLINDPQHLGHALWLALLIQVEAAKSWDTGYQFENSADYVTARWAEPVEAALLRLPGNCLPRGSGGDPPCVSARTDLISLSRESVEHCDYSVEQLSAIVERAFPSLFFKPNIWDEVRRFSLPYGAIRSVLVRALSDLNDNLPGLYGQCSPDEFAARFEACSTFKISPESPNTRRDRKKIAQRDIDISGHVLRCEWHLKIGPTADRIHFHAPVPGVSGERIIIGIFHEHLPT